MYRLGLIGYPIQHSLSPWIHNHFLKRAQLQGTYELIEINPQDSFEHAIQQLKKRHLDGFNITVPYKQHIMPYLDGVDPAAKRVGAVNTVLFKDDKWIGYNTDGWGYVRSLKSKFPDLFAHNDHNILVLGAGGAARGIYDAIANEGFNRVDIANRTITSAEDIAQLKPDHTKTNTMTLKDAEQTIENYDAVIQTTSVGMSPNINDIIISLNNLQTKTIMSDIVYQHIETRFLKEAQTIGAPIHYGHTMLLYQAQYAFEIWTGKRVPIEQLEQALREQLMEGK